MTISHHPAVWPLSSNQDNLHNVAGNWIAYCRAQGDSYQDIQAFISDALNGGFCYNEWVEVLKTARTILENEGK